LKSDVYSINVIDCKVDAQRESCIVNFGKCENNLMGEMITLDIDQGILRNFIVCPRKSFLLKKKTNYLRDGLTFVAKYEGMNLWAKVEKVIEIDGKNVVLISKASKSMRERHKIELAYLAFILLLNGKKLGVGIELLTGIRKVYPRIDRIPPILLEMKRVFNNSLPPEPTFSYACKNCPFHRECVECAVKKGDISMINGIGGKRKHALEKAGYLTVKDISAANPELISRYTGISSKEAQRIVKQAESIRTSQWFRLEKIEISSNKCEYFFDVEKGENEIYLFGVVAKVGKDDTYKYFIMGREWEEPWKNFLAFMNIYPDAPVYHYDVFDRNVVNKFATRSKMDAEDFIGRFVDLYKVVTRSFILPVRFYSLKDVARTVGFEWRVENFTGYEAMRALSAWEKSQDPEILKKIATYNEDDCRALMAVKEKMEKGDRCEG